MNIDGTHRGITKFKRRRRIGRGPGSARGKTAGRGHKGQKSRSGWSVHPTFQGGTMPLVRRVPKRGFHNRYALTVAIVNVGDLEKVCTAGDEVTPASLAKTPLLAQRYDELKILGDGQLSKKLKVSAHRFSRSAIEKIEQAGGEVVHLPGRTPVEEKKQRKARQQAAS